MGMIMPRFVEENLYYIDEETQEWKLKDNAPEWAVKEFAAFIKATKPTPDANGIITQI